MLKEEQNALKYFLNANKDILIGHEIPREINPHIRMKYPETESFQDHLRRQRLSMKNALAYKKIDPLLVNEIKNDLKATYASTSFFQSTVSLLGLHDNQARLIRGHRRNNDIQQERGIVLFTFQGVNYVFDPLESSIIINAEEYFKDFDEVFSDTRQNILDKNLADEFCIKEGDVFTVKEVDDEDVKKRKIIIMPNSRIRIGDKRFREHRIKEATLYNNHDYGLS